MGRFPIMTYQSLSAPRAHRINGEPPEEGSSCRDSCEFGGGGGGYLDSYRTTLKNLPPASEEADPDCPYPVELERTATNVETGEVEEWGIVEIPCNRKGCPVCGPKLRSRYVAHYSREFEQLKEKGYDVLFVTLTIDPKTGDGIDPGVESRKYLSYVWDGGGNGSGFYGRLRYRTNRLHYVGAVETHEDGSHHLHMVIAADWREKYEGKEIETTRSCWFSAGGGAVVDVKRPQPGEDRDSDGKPGTLRGALGYVVKYMFKDAQEATQGGMSYRTYVSHGIGYHGEEAKQRRREHAAGGSSDDEEDGGLHVELDPLAEGGPSPRDDRVKETDRIRFKGLDLSRRTKRFRQKNQDGTWTEFAYVRANGEWNVRWTLYDRFPEAERARELDKGRGQPDPVGRGRS